MNKSEPKVLPSGDPVQFFLFLKMCYERYTAFNVQGFMFKTSLGTMLSFLSHMFQACLIIYGDISNWRWFKWLKANENSKCIKFIFKSLIYSLFLGQQCHFNTSFFPKTQLWVWKGEMFLKYSWAYNFL